MATFTLSVSDKNLIISSNLWKCDTQKEGTIFGGWITLVGAGARVGLQRSDASRLMQTMRHFEKCLLCDILKNVCFATFFKMLAL